MASNCDDNAPVGCIRARFARGQRGAVAAEYVILLAVMGMMIAVGAMGLGNGISSAFTKSSKCMEKTYDGDMGRDNPCSNAPAKEDP